MEIFNRRYIGAKSKMLAEIYNSVIENFGYHKGLFADIFAGTGVVAWHFAKYNYPVLLNDNLYSNYVSYVAWLKNESVDLKKTETFISEVNKIDSHTLENNYFSDIYGQKYFSNNDAKKIGYIRDRIEREKGNFNEREYCYLITSLMYCADKIANTVGHFEYFLRKTPVDHEVILEPLNILNGISAQIYNTDTNLLARSICPDIAYIDPPYNARQYVNFYHVLENLVRWDKPKEFEGNSMKFKRDNLKSGYCRSVAPKLFQDLIENLNAKLLIVSYNNTYNAKSTASNNRVQEEEIMQILSQKGDVTIKEFEYKFFNAGKTNMANHKEKLYICKVK